jgi:hypothetical protein
MIFRFVKAECVRSTDRKQALVSLLFYDLFYQHVCGFVLKFSLHLCFTCPVLLIISYVSFGNRKDGSKYNACPPARLSACLQLRSLFTSLVILRKKCRKVMSYRKIVSVFSTSLSVCVNNSFNEYLSFFISRMTLKYSGRISLWLLACCFV